MNSLEQTSASGKTAGLRRMLRILLIGLLALPAIAAAMGGFGRLNGDSSASLTEVSDFGSNPGLLRMFKYVPANLGADRPLVVALHGCAQQAQTYDNETGWVALADKYGFALLLPEAEAHPARCFRWYDPANNERDHGEALSIRQMVGKMAGDHQTDARHVYITGLSAGGAMTAVMLSTYPEVFAGGAVIAGVPYKCAENENEAQSKCGLFGKPLAPEKLLMPAQWGDRVRAASAHHGPVPRVSLWHGSADKTVNPQDETELMEQWTDAHAIDQTPDMEETVAGHVHKVYQDRDGTPQVETWLVKGMGHGTPINPGKGKNQCGEEAPFVLPAKICSSLYIVRFWGLDPA